MAWQTKKKITPHSYKTNNEKVNKNLDIDRIKP